jgi:hypothetical protein
MELWKVRMEQQTVLGWPRVTVTGCFRDSDGAENRNKQDR